MLMTLSRNRNNASFGLGEAGSRKEKVKFSIVSPASKSSKSDTNINLPSGLLITTSDVEIEKSFAACKGRVLAIVVSYQI